MHISTAQTQRKKGKEAHLFELMCMSGREVLPYSVAAKNCTCLPSHFTLAHSCPLSPTALLKSRPAQNYIADDATQFQREIAFTQTHLLVCVFRKGSLR